MAKAEQIGKQQTDTEIDRHTQTLNCLLEKIYIIKFKSGIPDAVTGWHPTNPTFDKKIHQTHRRQENWGLAKINMLRPGFKL